MIRTFCDCCGEEITGSNTTADGNKNFGRLTETLKTKPGGMVPFMQVEVITATGSTWNGGHFCKYCVIDAISKLDDRPAADTVPAHKLREKSTELLNLRMDLQRLIDGEPTLCGFTEVEELKTRIAGVAPAEAPTKGEEGR